MALRLSRQGRGTKAKRPEQIQRSQVSGQSVLKVRGSINQQGSTASRAGGPVIRIPCFQYKGCGGVDPPTPPHHMVHPKIEFFLKLKTNNNINKDLGLMVLNTAETSHNRLLTTGWSKSSFQSLPRDLVSTYCMLPLVAQAVKHLPAVQETLGREDPLEEATAAHSSIRARRIPRTEEPGGLQSMGSQELDTT